MMGQNVWKALGEGILFRLLKKGPAFADLPTPAEAGASRRRERLPSARLLEAGLRAGRRNPESGVATNKERLLATPASW